MLLDSVKKVWMTSISGGSCNLLLYKSDPATTFQVSFLSFCLTNPLQMASALPTVHKN